MVLTPDTMTVLRHAAALVNSSPRVGETGVEDLPTIAALTAFFDAWRWTGARPRTRADLEAVHAMRADLRELWLLAGHEEELVARVNSLLAQHHALPQLARHDDLGWHIHATPPDAPFAARIAVESAMAFVDVIRAGETERLKVCVASDCDSVLVDLSRNRSRMFCEGTCATRTHVAAYRARKAVE